MCVCIFVLLGGKVLNFEGYSLNKKNSASKNLWGPIKSTPRGHKHLPKYFKVINEQVIK